MIWRRFSTYSVAIAGVGFVREQPDGASGTVADEHLRGLVQLDVGDPQLEGAGRAARASDNTTMPAMNIAEMAMPSGLLDRRSPPARTAGSAVSTRERRRSPAVAGGGAALTVTATAPETIIARMPVAYAPAWALTSAPERDRDHDADRGVDQHDRPHRPAPFRRHAVAGQVAGHDVDQAGHRRGAGEPEDQDAADVVDGAEALAELLVRQVGQRPAVRLRRPAANSSGGISTVVMKLVAIR